jgi:hypothetical protein
MKSENSMDSGDQFLTILTVTCGAVLAALILTVASVTKHNDKIILEMVEEGADPIAASCAVYDSAGDSPTCIAIAARTNVEGQ